MSYPFALPFAAPHVLARGDLRGRRSDRQGEAKPLAVEGGLTHPPCMPSDDQNHPLSPALDLPPGGPLSDEPQMETIKHARQWGALLELSDWIFHDREDVLASGNLTIFFSPEQIKQQDFRGPDFFVVLGTDRRRHRNSWVVWEEGGKFPDLIIELLSKSTRANDLGVKKQIYQDVFRTPEYYVFDPEKGDLLGFGLVNCRYERRAPDERGWLWSECLGHYLGVHDGQLRLFTRQGEIVPTGVERGLQAKAAEERARGEAQRAEAAEERARGEAQRAEAAEERANQLAKRLRQLGIDPDSGAQA